MPVRIRLPPALGRALCGAFLFLLLLWSLRAWDVTIALFFPGDAGGLVRWLGIHPRRLEGVPGILFGHLLHRDFGHLAANSLALFFLSFLVLLNGVRRFFQVTLFVALAGGFSIWLLEQSTTVGSSTLVFGYVGYVLARGFVEQRTLWIVAAFALLVIYGLSPSGLLPGASGVSWIAHVSGLAAGVAAARLFRSGPAPLTTIP